MQTLGIVLPTNRPEEYFSVIHDSFENLRPLLTMVKVVVCFNFQPPWTPTMMARTTAQLTAWGLEVRSLFSRPSKTALVSMNKLRDDAAQLCGEADWWLFADDNLQFRQHGTPRYKGGSAERYGQVIDYFNTFKACGIIMCEGTLGGTAAKYQIRPTRVGLIATARGLFYRNVGGARLYTPEEYQIKGGMCETPPAYRLMSQGYFTAKQFNNPTRHLHKHRFGDVVGPLHIANYERNIVPNAERYIRDLYDDPHWTHESRYVPKRVWLNYTAAGGDPDVFTTKKYHKDYAP